MNLLYYIPMPIILPSGGTHGATNLPPVTGALCTATIITAIITLIIITVTMILDYYERTRETEWCVNTILFSLAVLLLYSTLICALFDV